MSVTFYTTNHFWHHYRKEEAVLRVSANGIIPVRGTLTGMIP